MNKRKNKEQPLVLKNYFRKINDFMSINEEATYTRDRLIQECVRYLNMMWKTRRNFWFKKFIT